PNKIIVIVGGSSVLHGTGQAASQVWTRKLQEVLGERYQVINLALRCGRTNEFGQVAAEMLLAEYPQMIFICDCFSGDLFAEPDGLFYKYFYWDAYYKG